MQTQQTEMDTGNKRGAGRKGRDGSDEVIKIDPIKKATGELMKSYNSAAQLVLNTFYDPALAYGFSVRVRNTMATLIG